MLNMWSNVSNIWPFPCVDPFWVDLSVGYSYSFWIANTNLPGPNPGDGDIIAGTVELWGADADPTDACRPGPFHRLDPIAGCTAIVSGVAEPGPVTIDLAATPIRALSVCGFSAPCPDQFFQIRGLPAGAQAFAVVGNIRRTNWDHVTPWGYIPQPMGIGFESMMAQLPPDGRAALPPGQAPAPQQARAPQAQPQPQPAAQPPQRVPNPRPQPQPAR